MSSTRCRRACRRRGCRSIAIFNLACAASPPHYQADPEHTMLTNVLGTRNLLALAEKQRARFLLASTSEVYGDPDVHPQQESYCGNVNPTGPRACYDEGKRAAETLTFDYHRAGRADGAGRAHLQHLRPAHARPTTAASSRTSITQALVGRGHHGLRRRLADALLLLRGRSRRRADAPDALRRRRGRARSISATRSSLPSASSSSASSR